MIEIINPYNKKTIKYFGSTSCQDADGNVFPVENTVVRFVTENNYADSFGFQWNVFQQTQIDRENWQLQLSRDRLFSVTDWKKEDLENTDILEVGSGAGRFSRVILEETKANLYSIDYSDAILVNYKNNCQHIDRLHLYQANIYDMPFRDNSFDKVFCFGVLQHTPDFKKSIKSLVDKVKPGGELVVDFYAVNGWWTKVQAKYLLRPLTKNMAHEKLLRLIGKNAGWLINWYSFFDRIKVGKIVNRFLPICDIKGTLPRNLSAEELREWVILDTFDMFSPQHDHPQKLSTVKKWFEEFNMKVIFADYVTFADNKRAPIVKGIKL